MAETNGADKQDELAMAETNGADKQIETDKDRVDEVKQGISPDYHQSIEKLKESLATKNYTPNTQIELAKFLDLLTELKFSQDKLLDNKAEIINIALSIIAAGKEDNHIEFIKEARRVVERKIRNPPNPLIAFKFWKTIDTTPFYRLISGVMVFISLMVLIPGIALIISETYFWLSKSKEIKEENSLLQIETKELYGQLQQENEGRTALLEYIRDIDILAKINQESGKKYCKNIKNDIHESIKDDSFRSIQELCSELPLPEEVNNTLTNNEYIKESLTNNNNSINIIELLKETIYSSEISQYQSNVNNQNNANSTDQDSADQDSTEDHPDYSFLINDLADNHPDYLFLFWVAIAGGVGGVVSVVVRTKELINYAEDSGIDLFYYGFFRPLVGMAFGLLLICIIESGAFENVFALKSNEPDRVIYMYMAMSFVIGVSDVFANNLLIKAESTIKKN